MGRKMKETETLLGTNIRVLRTFYKLTAARLAELVEEKEETILRWERGEYYPSSGQLARLCSVFNVPLDVLTTKAIKI